MIFSTLNIPNMKYEAKNSAVVTIVSLTAIVKTDIAPTNICPTIHI